MSRFLGFYKELTVVSSMLLLFGCGNIPVSEDVIQTGSLEIRSRIIQNSLLKTNRSAQTKIDSIIVEVSSVKYSVIHHAVPVINNNIVSNDTVSNIPSDDECTVSVWTVDKKGNIIHKDSIVSHTVKVTANAVTQVYANLKPLFGSIYLQISNIPDTVDTLAAVFVESTGGRSWQVRVPRSPKAYLSIDNIPDRTSGFLSVFGIGPLNDTLYRASKNLIYSVNDSTAVTLEFYTQPGFLIVAMNITQPNSLLVNADMGSFSGDSTETGEVFITEIMYASNDSEYVELYNPSLDAIVFDTLKFDIDGEIKYLSNISIGSKSYFTIGRRILPWVNIAVSPVSFLDLVTNGNWVSIRKKNGQIIDRVIFTGANNTIEWPNISGKRSILLQQGGFSAIGNNYGKNWIAASSLISGSLTQYGTPGM